MNFTRPLFFFLIATLASSCVRPTNKYSDDLLVKISDFQDRRQADSLITYLLNRNPIYRMEAAKAFASIQDSVASLQLGTMLLEDPVTEARRAAAFALGQTPGTASVNALIPALEDRESSVVREALEGLGKTIQTYDLPTLKRFKPKDSIAQEGLAWAYYRVGLRGLVDTAIVSQELEFLKANYSIATRLGAAHFFSRTSKLEIQRNGELLALAAQQDKSVLVRMAATSGLRKLDSTKSIAALLSIVKNDPDYRVRISAVRAMAAWPTSTLPTLLTALTDSNQHVGVAASEVIKPTTAFRNAVHEIALSTKSFRIQSNLYRALINSAVDQTYIEEIKKLYQSSTNDYQKASLLLALSGDLASGEFISQELLNTTSLVIKSTAAQALVNINQQPGFQESLKKKFAEIYQQAILTGDPGVIGTIAGALTNPKNGYNSIIKDITFLQEAKKKLVLPKDIEALQPLEEAIAFLEGKEKPPTPKNQFNHPIDWKLVKTISADQRVKVETTRGTIVLRLLVDEAPGSVANFVELVNKKYFDGKFFHRVVPNFVIQTGCNRGDGFGSEDYSIRSEFSMSRYKEGSVGMASAGKDTEGTQWFITHSPTPHLDGRYTIFAEVVEGMNIVHAIQVGDKINTASLF